MNDNLRETIKLTSAGAIRQIISIEKPDGTREVICNTVDPMHSALGIVFRQLGWRPPDDHTTEAERACVAIYEDFTPQEITKEPTSIRNAWALGEIFKRPPHDPS